MASVDLGWLRTTNGLVMIINLAAAICAIIFWESSDIKKTAIKNRSNEQIFYTAALAIALIIVTIVFFLTLCGKLTKRVVAMVFLGIACILVVVAVLLILINDGQDWKVISLMCAAVLAGGIVANLVYTGVGGLRITT